MLKRLVYCGIVAAIVFAIGDAPCQAAENSITTGFVSKHSQPGYNENNYGIGYERKLDNGWSLGVGYYRNSLNKDSYYVGASYRPFAFTSESGRFSCMAGVTMALVTGYRFAVVPGIAPSAECRFSSFAVEALALPPIPNVTPALAALRLKYYFGD